MKLRIKSMIWNIRKKKTTDRNSKNQKEIQKIKDRLRSLWNNFKLLVCRKGKRKSIKLKMYLKK